MAATRCTCIKGGEQQRTSSILELSHCMNAIIYVDIEIELPLSEGAIRAWTLVKIELLLNNSYNSS